MPLVPAKCTQCGANIEVDDKKDAAICPFCGTAYIVEKAISNFIVHSENSISLTKLIQNIDTFVELESWDRAEKACEEVINNYPEDYRGWWRKVIIESRNFSTNTISPRMRDNYAIAYKLADGLCRPLIKLTFEKYDSQCKEIEKKIKSERKKGINNAEYCNRYSLYVVNRVLHMDISYTEKGYYIDYTFDKFTYIFGNTVKYRMSRDSITFDSLDRPCKGKDYMDCKTTCGIYVDYNIEELFAGEKTVSEQISEQQGCYIATCVYGSYNCPEVWTLRRFRDYTLDETWYGKAFIRCYYKISPSLVKWFGNQKWFKSFWKKQLDYIVSKLNQKGIESTPYQDRY